MVLIYIKCRIYGNTTQFTASIIRKHFTYVSMSNKYSDAHDPSLFRDYNSRITVSLRYCCFGTSFWNLLLAAKSPLIIKDLGNIFMFSGHQGSFQKCERQIVVPSVNTLGSKICQIICIAYVFYHLCSFRLCHRCLVVSKVS